MRDQSTRTVISVAMNVLNSDSGSDGGRSTNSGLLLDITPETSLAQSTGLEDAVADGERVESRQGRSSIVHIFVFNLSMYCVIVEFCCSVSSSYKL